MPIHSRLSVTTQTAQDPEQLRREIARTRADMDRTLAELEDRVSPTRIRERQTEKVRGRLDRAKSAVMGAAPDGGQMRGRTSGMADRAGGTLDDAGDTLQQTRNGSSRPPAATRWLRA